MLGTTLRQHRVLVTLLAIGALIRIGMLFAYYPAYGYFYDTRGYLDAAKITQPGTIWPFGYSAMLKVLDKLTGYIVSVSIVQHLMGLAMGVAVYALLTRRGVRRNWSALAAAPVLLDARQIQLEHFVLSETLFSFLLLTSIVLLMWTDKPPLWLMGLSGGVLALATLTRTVGQPLAVLVILYLIVRRIGWQRIAAFAVALIIPIGGYMVWYHHTHGAYALNGFSGRYMWQRTTTFVDCSRTDFTPAERRLCPPEPLGQREVGDVYLWGLDKNRVGGGFDPKRDKLFSQFAVKAIKGQPGDFLAAIGTDAWHLVQPGWVQPDRIACTTDLWTQPSGKRASGRLTTGPCNPSLMTSDFKPATEHGAGQKATTLNSALWAYANTWVIPPSVLVLLSLFAVFAAARRSWGRRRFSVREATDSALLALMSLGILLLGITLSVIDLRFTVPLLVLVPLSAALAAHRLKTGPPPVPPAETPAEPTVKGDPDPAPADPTADAADAADPAREPTATGRPSTIAY